MLPRIFIGGTGRSGTSILKRALGCHEAIYAVAPGETRYLIDPDGLIDLVDALTVRYSVVQAREALFRFERLMRVYLTVPQVAPYRGYDLAHRLGEEYYWRRLEEFTAELTEAEFAGSALQVEPDNEGRLVTWARRLRKLYRRLRRQPFVPGRLSLPRTTLKVVKYFPDRNHLVSLAASFVDDLFLNAAHANGKETWCEKTPSNLLHIDFLWELFPESVVIHIKRDPRGIVHSFTKQFWAPADVRNACLMLKVQYERWFDIVSTINLNKSRYLEIKLEDLAASPQSVL